MLRVDTTQRPRLGLRPGVGARAGLALRLLAIVVFDNYDNGALRSAASTSLLYILVILALVVIAKALGARATNGETR